MRSRPFDAGIFSSGSSVAAVGGNNSNTKLLLPTLGDQGSTGHELTLKGTPSIVSFNAEGNSIVNHSGFFNGVDGFITITDHEDFNVGSGDFTVEILFYKPVDNVVNFLCGQVEPTYTLSETGIYMRVNSDNTVRGSVGISGDTYHHVSSTGTVVPGFNHAVFERIGTNLYMFLNGTMSVPTSVGAGTVPNSSQNFSIGRAGTITTDYLKGYTAVFALHKGVARYTTDFTPPKSITEITNDSNTKLLIDFTEISQGETPATFTDSSVGGGHTVTNVGSKVSGCTFWWDGALSLNGTTDYATVMDHTALTKGTNDFVVHGWLLFPPNDSTLYRVMGQTNSAADIISNALYIIIDPDNTIRGGYTDRVTFYNADTIDTLIDGANHFALVKSGNELAMHLNGYKGIGTADVTGVTSTDSSSNLSIGRQGEYAPNLFQGLVGELEIIIGSDNGWGSTVTVPTSKTIPGSNTKLLFSPSGNSAIGGESHDLTFSDGVVISQEAPTGFNQSYELNGTTGVITILDSDDFDFIGSSAQDGSIDLQVKFADHAGTETLICQREDDNNLWAFEHVHGTGFQFRVVSDAITFTSCVGGEITDTNWHRVLLAKVTSAGPTVELGIYIDTAQVAYISEADIDTFSGPLQIGALNGTNFFAGNIAEIRIQNNNDDGAAPNSGLTDTIILPIGPYTEEV